MELTWGRDVCDPDIVSHKEQPFLVFFQSGGDASVNFLVWYVNARTTATTGEDDCRLHALLETPC
jgi:hypothetical protein